MENFLRHIREKNYISLIVTLTLILIPFIKFDGYHLLLFNFYDERFEIFFRAWETSVTSLVIVFIIFAFCIILGLNFTLSRYFCGTMCPKTLLKNFFTNIIEIRLFKNAKILNLNSEERIEKNILKTIISYIFFGLFIFLASVPFILYLIPYDKFFLIAKDGFEGYSIVLWFWVLSSIYLFAEALFFKEFFCSYICPYQLVSSVTVNDKRDFYNFMDKERCIDCDACVKVCPVPKLDIKKGFDTRCISCGDCSAICADIMEKEGVNTSLIEYSDFNGVKNKNWFFSFSSKTVSLVLFLTTLIMLSFAISYLIDTDNLTHCNFNNSDLYKNRSR